MGLLITKKINDFSLGMTSELRDPDTRYASLLKNFDAHTYKRKLVPFRSSEDGDDAGNTSKKKNFCVALRTGTTHSLYALGVKSGATTAEVLYKDLTTGAANDLDDNAWAATGAAAKYQSASGATDFNLFVYYRKVGRIFGAKAGTTIWVYDPAGSADFLEDGTGNSLSLTYTNIAQGLVHSKDDILYVPYDNKIAKNDNGVWTAVALTLPEHFYITSICEMGNNIAIAMAPLSGAIAGQSRVFIWDRDPTLTTLSETIPWEEGQLQILEVVNGYLVGISISGNTATRHNVRISFRFLDGNNIMGYRATPIMELVAPTRQESAPPDSGTGTIALPIAKQMINGRLHFLMQIYINGEQRNGVWSIGKVGDSFALNHERTPNNDTALTSAVLYNFFYVGDYLFIIYDD